MSFTGFLAVIVGIAYSVVVDRNPMHLLSRWHDAAIIDLKPADRAALERSFRRWSLLWQYVIAGIILGVLIVVYRTLFSRCNLLENDECSFSKLLPGQNLLSEFSIASFVCAFLVGLRIARLINHGRMGLCIVSRGVSFELTIEHPDRAGGTAQIGTFYFLQASVLITPVLWLLIWILQIRLTSDYSNWITSYYWYLTIAFTIFVLAFLLPMLAFHRAIRDWKRKNYPGEVSIRKNELLKLRAINSPTLAQRQRRAETAQQLENLVALPDWPVSPTIRNVFVTTFILPLVANVLAFIAGIVTT